MRKIVGETSSLCKSPIVGGKTSWYKNPPVKKLDAQKLVGANPGWLKLIGLKPVQVECAGIWMYLGLLSAP